MLDLTKDQMRWRLKARLFIWLAGLIILVFTFLLLIVVIMTFWEEALQGGLFFVVVIMFVAGLASFLLMFQMVIYEFYPNSYYEGLITCPECKEESMKCMTARCRCFDCGHTIIEKATE